VSPKRIDHPRQDKLREVSEIVGHEFRDLGLLHRALSHSSLGNEGLPDYERLEFLGDAVLGFLVAETLYKRKPEIPVGELTSRRSLMVSRRPLAIVAEELDLGSYLMVGRGLTDASLRSPRILADLVEAVLAAIYLDGGIRSARRFVQKFVIERFQDDHEHIRGTTDAKTRLNQWAQAEDIGTPRYEIVETTGPDHDPTFRVTVSLAGVTCRSSEVKSKQIGEQEAAAACLLEMTGAGRGATGSPNSPEAPSEPAGPEIQIVWDEPPPRRSPPGHAQPQESQPRESQPRESQPRESRRAR
jgi:ribonuclease III